MKHVVLLRHHHHYNDGVLMSIASLIDNELRRPLKMPLAFIRRQDLIASTLLGFGEGTETVLDVHLAREKEDYGSTILFSHSIQPKNLRSLTPCIPSHLSHILPGNHRTAILMTYIPHQ